jgi:hypothetical protein
VGGSEEKKTTYTYEKQWSALHISSEGFKEKRGHENPGEMPIKAGFTLAEKSHVGAFNLPSQLLNSIKGNATLPLKESDLEGLRPDLRAKAKIKGSGIYIGDNADTPQVGDLKIMFTVVHPTQVSVFGAQRGTAIAPYQTKAGDALMRLTNGTKSASEMFKSAHEANATLTWILRGVGFALMFLGGFLVLRPFAVLADVLPFLGSFLRMGIGLFVGLLSFFGSFTVIGMAWVFYRPLIGIPLLLVAAGAAVALVMGALKNRKKVPAG